MRNPGVIAHLVLLALAGCGAHRDPPDPSVHLELASSTLTRGEIPQRFACVESGAAPALSWSAPPPEASSLVVIVRDLDSPFQWLRGPFVHWVVYDIPVTTRELHEGTPAQPEFEDGMRQGTNEFGKIGFGGPCPPGSGPHRYEFKLFALSTALNIASGAGLDAVIDGMQGHVVATGILLARYQRP